jgi:uncharacterized SAM-binding protein YcdF (DUF218 family)
MREFLSLIIMPVPVSFMLFITAFIFNKLNRKRTARVLLWILGLWILVITTSPLPKWLVKSLESQYHQVSETLLKGLTDSCNIIVLGVNYSDDKNLSPNNQLSTTALGRLVEGIRIQRIVPGSKLILSGSGSGVHSELTQALVLYRTAIMLGVDSVSMSMLPLPVNTSTEAKEYVKKFGKSGNLILVTCAVHMPRAVMLFKKAGVNPIPAPTNFILTRGTHKYRWRWIPSSENIKKMEIAIHEYAGFVWAWLGGY